MASAKTTAEFNCSPEQFFKIIADFEKYPQFLKEVKNCKVLKVEGSKKLVEFQVSVIKTINYRLWVEEKPPLQMTWSFESGDLFKISNGSWHLQDVNGKTKADYWVEATFNVFVPSPIAKALVQVNLPGMVIAYTNRVKELYGT